MNGTSPEHSTTRFRTVFTLCIRLKEYTLPSFAVKIRCPSTRARPLKILLSRSLNGELKFSLKYLSWNVSPNGGYLKVGSVVTCHVQMGVRWAGSFARNAVMRLSQVGAYNTSPPSTNELRACWL